MEKPARELVLDLIRRKLIQAIHLADNARTAEDAEAAQHAYLSAQWQCRNLGVRAEFHTNANRELDVRFHPRPAKQPAAQPVQATPAPHALAAAAAGD